jgi:hypothetical protein
MTATLVHSILTWFGAGMSVVAALFWIKSTLVKVLSPDTSGWGALIGGMVVVPGPNDERLDLVGTLKQQASRDSDGGSRSSDWRRSDLSNFKLRRYPKMDRDPKAANDYDREDESRHGGKSFVAQHALSLCQDEIAIDLAAKPRQLHERIGC